jgi:hypothetical protein
MKRLPLLAVLMLGATGCLSPLTGRLDRISQQLEDTKQQLTVVSAKLDQADRELAAANQRLENIERLMKRFPGLGRDTEAGAPPLAQSADPIPLGPREPHRPDTPHLPRGLPPSP